MLSMFWSANPGRGVLRRSLAILPNPGSVGCLVGMGLFLIAATGGCEKFDLSRRFAAPPAPQTVQETFEFLRANRASGAYGAMRPYIHPSGREEIISLLIAVDELMLANAAALAAAQQACPSVDVRHYDLSIIEDNLELFSRDVELVNIKQQGTVATGTVQISKRLPLVRLQFEQQEGAWQYVPGAGNSRIVPAIRSLARTLRQIELVLAAKHLSADQIEDEYRTRLLPRLKKFQADAAASSPG